MLAQLTINNFAIVRELDIDFQHGMSAITGETGAGKSIAIDALGLCLGERSDGNTVRPQTSRTDICARFSLDDTPSAWQWLKTHHLDDGNECLLRRSISTDGRSRGFINSTTVPLSQLRELGQHLIQIHGQHAHQLLLKPEYQKQLLDAWAVQPQLLMHMQQTWQLWHQSCRTQTLRQQQMLKHDAHQQLLQYHLKELNEFAPHAGEYEQMDAEYKRLANNSRLQSVSKHALELLTDDDEQNILGQLQKAKLQLAELTEMDDKFHTILTMLEDASIQISEASDELRHYGEQPDLDPERFCELEQRLSQLLSLARKHRVKPEDLPTLYQQLLDEQQLLTQQENEHEELSKMVDTHYQQAVEIASQLHQRRQHYAEELAKLVTESMHQLSMPHGRFGINVRFQPEYLNARGASVVDFCVTTNPGQPLQPLVNVTSGGELSRIALAIQVITARKMETPALIFDEIDVGISGPTAATVGHMLRQLGESTQVICVTHLPQVAGCAHQHFCVSKKTDGAQTETQIHSLNKQGRLQELARLLGGNEITKNTLANASELLTA